MIKVDDAAGLDCNRDGVAVDFHRRHILAVLGIDDQLLSLRPGSLDKFKHVDSISHALGQRPSVGPQDGRIAVDGDQRIGTLRRRVDGLGNRQQGLFAPHFAVAREDDRGKTRRADDETSAVRVDLANTPAKTDAGLGSQFRFDLPRAQRAGPKHIDAARRRDEQTVSYQGNAVAEESVGFAAW